MPLNDFYTFQITKSSENDNNFEVEITINKNHKIFEGHFPEQPVTPGVTLVEMVRAILSKNFGAELMLKSAKELKFLAPVIPSVNEKIMLHVSWELMDGQYRVSCQFKAADKTLTKLKGIFCVS